MAWIEETVIGVLPGGGWYAKYRCEDGATFRSQVVGWAISTTLDAEVWTQGTKTYRSFIDLTPLICDSDGSIDAANESSNFVGLYHPADDKQG